VSNLLTFNLVSIKKLEEKDIVFVIDALSLLLERNLALPTTCAFNDELTENTPPTLALLLLDSKKHVSSDCSDE